jgi:hypothetical protein
MVDWTKHRSVRIGEIYGYIVLLIALLTFLINIDPFVDAVYGVATGSIDYWSCSSHLESFPKYKYELIKSATRASESQTPVYIPDDESIREMMEAEKANEIAKNRLIRRRNLISYTVLEFTCIVLFAWHWIWLRRITRSNGAVPGKSQWEPPASGKT